MTTSGSLTTNGLSPAPAAAPDNNLLMRSDLEFISAPRFRSPTTRAGGRVERSLVLLFRGAARPDRRRPLLDLALDELGQVAGAALVRRHDIEAEILQLGAHRRIVHYFRERGIEL